MKQIISSSIDYIRVTPTRELVHDAISATGLAVTLVAAGLGAKSMIDGYSMDGKAAKAPTYSEAAILYNESVGEYGEAAIELGVSALSGLVTVAAIKTHPCFE